MSYPGFTPRNHPQQVRRRGALDGVDDRATNAALFDAIEREHGPFTLDVAASAANAKCRRFFDRAADGLSQSWAGEAVWCNPPYSDVGPWVAKAWAEAAAARSIVMLLPANRCEQGWWQALVEPFRDRPGSRLRSHFLAGRPRFLRPGQRAVGPNERPPFGCVLLVWRDLAPGPPDGPLVAPPPYTPHP